MMLRRTIFVLLTGLLIPATAHAASLGEEVKATYAAFDAAFNTGKPAAVAGFFTENALYLPASPNVLKGRAAIQKFYAGLFKSGLHGHKLELIEANGDDHIIVAAARFSIETRSGPNLE